MRSPAQKPGILLGRNRLSDAEPHDRSPEFALSLPQRAGTVDAAAARPFRNQGLWGIVTNIAGVV